jgi:hypothetical protein
VEINYRTYSKAPKNQLCFHAQYRQGTPPPEGPYLILDAKGRGHLIGCVLSVKNNDGGWWGEGDEIVYINGKHAIQGTGSEDYFGESYGLRPGCFPYFGVTICDEPFTTAYRWHVPDPVTFQKSIRFLIEQGNGNPPFRSGNYYYSVAYWYQTEPHAPFPKLPSAAERSGWDAPAEKDAIEGEDMKILSKGGETWVQTEGRWSRWKQLLWQPANVGDKLELALPVAKSGHYKLVLHNTVAKDYGIFQLRLDGEKLGGPLDLYSAANRLRATALDPRTLAAGEHRLTVEAVGANPAAKPGRLFGLDYVKLEPAP